MSIKINSISLIGVRGIKNQIDLPLNGKSILLYGENGSGKSSISDSIEWFYTDKVSHLSGIEIDLKNAMRNSALKDTDITEVGISYSLNNLNCIKKLFYQGKKLITETTNNSYDFDNYIKASHDENILLRYKCLTDFIDNTKGEKLKYLSDIIGYSELTKVKETLKKCYNAIKIEIKTQNFEAQINTQKQILIEKIGASISQENDLFEKINKILEPLHLGIVVKQIDDIEIALEFLKKPENNKLINDLAFIEKVNNIINTIKSEVDLFNTEYTKYYNEFIRITGDIQNIKQIYLGELLRIGKQVLEKNLHENNSCPLCLQSIDKKELHRKIIDRLEIIEEISKKENEFRKAKQVIENIVIERLKRLETILSDKQVEDKSFKDIKAQIELLKDKLLKYQMSCEVKVISGKLIPAPNEIKLSEKDFVINGLTNRISSIKETLEQDQSIIYYSNISASKDAFIKIKLFEKQKAKLEKQRKSLEIIYNEFVKKHKEALENFIASFSFKINEYYQYMNPGEPFQEIRIITIGEEDELNGITIEYLYNNVWVSPPQKYFSESHLNCFGLSFFLASVEAFNNKNEFIIFDDVISSFDSNHRKRFADLLFEKFSKYQIILLTHEFEWFNNIVKPLAKNRGWIINEILWDDISGTYINGSDNELKEFIESSIQSGVTNNLGNPIRRYLEHALKEICFHLDVKVSFRYNDVNEKRMPNELLLELKSRIKKKSSDLKQKLPIIDRVANSSILGNLLSHDNSFNPKIGDLKAFWNDILEFEKIFICQESACKKPNVSFQNYDKINKKIRCGCEKISYDWD